MSMPLHVRGVPSSLTVPVILPSAAAFTVGQSTVKPSEQQQMLTSSPRHLQRDFICFSPCRASFLARLAGCELALVALRRVQSNLPGNLLLFALHRLQGTQVEHQFPGLIGLHVVGTMRASGCRPSPVMKIL